MVLTFDRELVETIFQHSLSSEDWNECAYEDDTRQPGLWLVGDRGVYLMSNGKPGLQDPFRGGTAQWVAYADQVNPLTLSPEQWVPAKVASFGADDGTAFLPAEFVEEMLKRAGGEPKVKLEVNEDDIILVEP